MRSFISTSMAQRFQLRPAFGRQPIRMPSRILTLAAALVLGVSYFVVDTTAHAAPATTDIDSTQLVARDATKTFASGVVRNAKGAAAKSGTVTAYAFPGAAVTKNLKVGDSFTLTEVGRAEIQFDGSYALSLDYDAVVQKSGTGGRPVNIDIVASTTDGTAVYSDTALVDPGKKKLTVNAAATPTTKAAASTAGVATRSVAGTSQGLALDLAVTSQSPAKLQEPASIAVAPMASIPSNCKMVKDLGNVWTVVGQTAATTTNAQQRIYYQEDATTTFGVALKVNGVYTMSGTTTFQASTTVNFPIYTAIGARKHRTQFKYAELSCTYGSTQIAQISARPIAFATGTDELWTTTPSTPASNCAPYLAGSGLNKKNTTASTFSNGVSIKSKIGIDLSSRSGYSATVRHWVNFTKPGKLCGVDGVPGDAPGLMVVK